MLNIPSIEHLQLSNRALNALHRAGIHTVEDLSNASIEELSQKKNIGQKTLKEIQAAILEIPNIYIDQSDVIWENLNQDKLVIIEEDSIKEDPIEDTFIDEELINEGYINKEIEYEGKAIDRVEIKKGYSDDQLIEMSRHTIAELELSNRSQNALYSRGLSTIDKVAVLSKEDLLGFRGLGTKSINEIIKALERWCKENTFYLNENVSHKRTNISNEFEELFKGISSALEPLIHVYWEKLFVCTYESGEIELIDLDNQSKESFEHNIQIVLYIPEICQELKKFWTHIAPQGLIEISDAEEILGSLGLIFDFHLIIWCCLKSGIICEDRNYYLIKRPTLEESLTKFKDSNDRTSKILIERLSGVTLQDIGEEFGITRERIRQITTKTLRKIPPLFEDYFAEPFETFSLAVEEFKLIFPELSNEAYRYLSIRYKKGKTELGEESIHNYGGVWKDRLSEYIIEKAERLDKSNITRPQMILRFLIQNADTPLSTEEFEEEYYKFIYKNGFPLEKLKINSMRSLMNHLRNTKGIVFNHDNKVRYCAADPKIIWGTVDFNAYKNTVISAELIYKEYQDLMEDLDIRDGYELFYVIKTSLDQWAGTFEINCRRVPVLVLGQGSEEEQALKLLKEISPVNYLDYFAAYEERYGIRKESAPGNTAITDAISPYYLEGKYIIDLPAIDESDVGPFVKELDEKSIWFIDEIEELFDQICVHSSRDAINAAAFRRIGYILNAGYAFSEIYGNAATYMDEEVFSQDIIDLTALDRRLTGLSAFTSLLEKKRSSLEYIETAPKVLLSMKKVREVYGLTVDDIQYIQRNLERYQDFYFNANSIWDEIQNEDFISNLQGNKWLLTNIMRQQEDVFSYRIGGNIILSRDSTSLKLSKICEWLVMLYGETTINSLTKIFNDTFGCQVMPYKIAEKIRESGLWDDLVTDSMDKYIDDLVESSADDIEDLLQEEFF